MHLWVIENRKVISDLRSFCLAKNCSGEEVLKIGYDLVFAETKFSSTQNINEPFVSKSFEWEAYAVIHRFPFYRAHTYHPNFFYCLEGDLKKKTYSNIEESIIKHPILDIFDERISYTVRYSIFEIGLTRNQAISYIEDSKRKESENMDFEAI